MRTIYGFTLISLITLSSSGCFGPSLGGYFDEHAYYSSRQHYRIRYISGGESQHAFLPADWRLDNFQRGPDGLPTRPMLGPEHIQMVTLDRNQDGRIDTWSQEPTNDLHFEREAENAAIWVHTLPLSGSQAQRSLPSITATVIEAFISSEDPSKWSQRSRFRLGAHVVDEGPATFGATEAHRAVFEVHNLDVDEQSAERVPAMAYVVVARPRATWRAGGGRGGESDVPMVVLFVYVAHAQEFEAHRGAFESLLHRTDFQQQ